VLAGRSGLGFYALTPLEIATGWVSGYDRSALDGGGPRSDATISPVEALERALRPALCRPPCLVRFSGGRDSSVVLAAAATLARREGLDDPVPLTQVFPGDRDADEAAWQELVLRHLGLQEWIRQRFSAELDVLGPVARPLLLRHGVLWPARIYGQMPMFEAARGGSLVSGEGGDELFGPWRLTPIAALGRTRSLGDRRARHLAAGAVAPRPVRSILLRRWLTQQPAPPWLRAPAWRAAVDGAVADALEEPLRWDRAVALVPARRAVRIGLFRNLRLLADEAGVLDAHPLLESGFVAAVGRLGGWRGFPTKTDALRRLFGHLLPDAVLARADKALFNATAVQSHSRKFIEGWDGTGVDPELVDADALRHEWVSDGPDARSLLLLQQAWLASNGVGA